MSSEFAVRALAAFSLDVSRQIAYLLEISIRAKGHFHKTFHNASGYKSSAVTIAFNKSRFHFHPMKELNS